jgi:ABC-type sugar transport system, permease component
MVDGGLGMKKRVGFIFLIMLAIIICSPVILLLSGSITGVYELQGNLRALRDGYSGFVKWQLIPRFPTLQAYVEILLDTPEFFVMFWNSVKIVVGVIGGQVLIAVTAAWGLAKGKFPGRKLLFWVYMILMMMPFQVTMLSQYLLLDMWGFLDTLAAIIVPGIFSTFPVFMMYRFFEGIPDSILEAAKIDGAGELKVFITIGLPLGLPGIVSVMVLGFLEYWNLIEQPLTFLQTKSLWPLSLYLPNIEIDKVGIAFVASIIAMMPSLLVFLYGQDYLEQGIMASAVKE